MDNTGAVFALHRSPARKTAGGTWLSPLPCRRQNVRFGPERVWSRSERHASREIVRFYAIHPDDKVVQSFRAFKRCRVSVQ